MSQKDIMHILERVSSGELSPSEAALELKMEPFQDLGFAKIDHHRELRQGIAEVIYGEGKTPEQILKIVEAMLERGQKTVLITRMSAKAAELVSSKHDLDYRVDARLGIVGVIPEPDGVGTVVVATGGTTDIPVAEEAAVTAEILGNKVTRLYDVGVSGVHRPAVAHAGDHDGACYRRRCRNGGRAAVGYRRTCRLPGDRRADERGLRSFIRRSRCTA